MVIAVELQFECALIKAGDFFCVSAITVQCDLRYFPPPLLPEEIIRRKGLTITTHSLFNENGGRKANRYHVLTYDRQLIFTSHAIIGYNRFHGTF